MEVMHEIYKTLQVLNMQWKMKARWDAVDQQVGAKVQPGGGVGGREGREGRDEKAKIDKEKRQKDKQMEEKYNQGLFFVETRCRIDDVVVS